MHKWKVVPISNNQLKDVSSEDLVRGGDFRICQTYKGGGGYDRFPFIAAERGLVSNPELANRQLVVQLFGCNLDCPYCYVTRSGVWGKYTEYPTGELVDIYHEAQAQNGANVFHLMGGAPALYLRHWPELVDYLCPSTLFHSDLMLSESLYTQYILRKLDHDGVLLAVNIKGTTPEEWLANTRKPMNEELIRKNLSALKTHLDPARWYLTFTNVTEDRQRAWVEDFEVVDQYYYNIDLIDYNAVPFVDSVPWGRVRGGKRIYPRIG